jgi:hypothetical protein
MNLKKEEEKMTNILIKDRKKGPVCERLTNSCREDFYG